MTRQTPIPRAVDSRRQLKARAGSHIAYGQAETEALHVRDAHPDWRGSGIESLIWSVHVKSARMRSWRMLPQWALMLLRGFGQAQGPDCDSPRRGAHRTGCTAHQGSRSIHPVRLANFSALAHGFHWPIKYWPRRWSYGVRFRLAPRPLCNTPVLTAFAADVDDGAAVAAAEVTGVGAHRFIGAEPGQQRGQDHGAVALHPVAAPPRLRSALRAATESGCSALGSILASLGRPTIGMGLAAISSAV